MTLPYWYHPEKRRSSLFAFLFASTWSHTSSQAMSICPNVGTLEAQIRPWMNSGIYLLNFINSYFKWTYLASGNRTASNRLNIIFQGPCQSLYGCNDMNIRIYPYKRYDIYQYTLYMYRHNDRVAHFKLYNPLNIQTSTELVTYLEAPTTFFKIWHFSSNFPFKLLMWSEKNIIYLQFVIDFKYFKNRI